MPLTLIIETRLFYPIPGFPTSFSGSCFRNRAKGSDVTCYFSID